MFLKLQTILQTITSAHENFRAKLPGWARLGIIALLIAVAFVILIFQAEFLMRYMIVLLPIFFVAAAIAVGLKRALYGTAVFIFFSFALWLRVGPSYDAILGGPVVQFQGNDADYHMRIIENMVQHFPNRISFDAYTLYPTGEEIPFAPFFDFLIALFIWIAGLGHPSALLVEKMGAYYPAVLGSLVIIPVYFIGKEIFNSRNAGLLAAGMLAILPGEFLFRSLLGFTDHHISETLFSTIVIMFLIIALKRAQELPPTFSNIKNREWANLKKPLIFAALAGLMFGLYLMAWIGSSLFVFILFIYFVIQFILDHLNGKSTDYLILIGLPIFILPLVMTLPFMSIISNSKYALASLGISAAFIIILSLISMILNRKKTKRIFYPITIAIVGAALAGIFHLISPSLFNSITSFFNGFIPNYKSLTIMEAQPFLGDFHRSVFFQHRLWQYFTTGIFLAGIAFLVIVYSAVKANKLAKWSFLSVVGIFLLTGIIWIVSFSASIYCRPLTITFLIEMFIIIGIYCYCERDHTKTLLIIWSFIILAALLGQTRFAYYFAVNVALLSCYLLWKMPAFITKIFQLIGWKEALAQEARTTKALKKSKNKELEDQRAFNYFTPKRLSGFLSVIVIFFLTVYPNFFYGTHNQTSYPTSECYNANAAFCPSCSAALFLANHPYTTSKDWYDSMVWMRSYNESTKKLNTPDPFGNDSLYINNSFYGKSFYYSLYNKPSNGSYAYPSTAYGVMSWWDYGHWITRIAHRIPNANPFQSGIGGPGPNGTIIPGASTFLTAQDEAAGSAILDSLGSKYVVIDYLTAGVLANSGGNSIFSVIPTWAGQNANDYYEAWYQQTSDGFSGLLVFYPMYYKSMCVRLYNFGAEAAVPDHSTWALAYREVSDGNGGKVKVLTSAANNGSAFATYEDAEKFVQANPSYTIVGLSPLRSPIPLDALKSYKLIHSSESIVTQLDNRSLSYVEIFEYASSQ